MDYISTRSSRETAERISAAEAVIRGLAPDGGLYIPVEIPCFGVEKIAEMDYTELAFQIMSLYFDDYTDEELRICVEGAYDEGFDDELRAPLKQVGDIHFLELFHGKTLAFKDMALSILPRLMTAAAKKTGLDKEIVILTATSGDTGGAALAGFAGVEGIKAIVFYPQGGVSEIQRLQMVSREENNVFVSAVIGNFDDAQRAVKKIFSDKDFAKELSEKGVILSSANSINIGRFIPQIVYYYYAYAQLIKNNEIKIGEKIDFVVPTGNFGNILAGYYAYKMGLPIGRLICASNINNVLYDFFNEGIYDANREFVLTSAPAMDILVSSNLERLIYDLSGRDGVAIKACMDKLSSDGKYEFKEKCGIVESEFATEAECFAAIKKMFEQNYLMDTHTAVAVAALEKVGKSEHKTVITSTASPYKFGVDVYKAVSGVELEESLALKELEKASGVEIPEAIASLSKKSIVHGGVIEISEMQDFVVRAIGKGCKNC